jgi:cobalt-zinc-cadmium efflux system outer membrane protein
MEESMTGRTILNTAAGSLAGLLITGCAVTGRQIPLPEARPLGAGYPTVSRAEPGDGHGAEITPAIPTGTLTLEQALAAALLRNPTLAAHSHGVRAAEARLLQAGVLPNPEIALEVEEYDRDSQGFDSAETAVVLAQAFELGGKRRWRKQVAEAEGELAGWAYEGKRLEVFAETAARFYGVLAAQEQVALAKQAVELAQQTSTAVGERVKAGKEPPIQELKSEAELEMTRLATLMAENDLALARRTLAAMWGAETTSFDAADGSLDGTLRALPSLGVLRSRLEQHPDLERRSAELRLLDAGLAAEKAARVPDLAASIGYLQFEEDGTDAFAVGVGMPLPLFDRNRGNIAAAQQELAKAKAEQSATEVALATELAEAHAALTAAHRRAGTLRAKVVPAMEKAFQSAHEGYQQGKFGFLDVLDAQRSLIEARSSLVDALQDYRVALIGIQRLTGTGIDELMTIEEENRK